MVISLTSFMFLRNTRVVRYFSEEMRMYWSTKKNCLLTLCTSDELRRHTRPEVTIQMPFAASDSQLSKGASSQSHRITCKLHAMVSWEWIN